jgi:biotin carboxylase
MKVRKSICVVVDAYSTANALPGVFLGYGFDTLHVQSSEYIPQVLMRSFRRGDFLDNLVFDGDLEALCAKLAPHRVRCVVAGAESGVRVADQLAERLGLDGNGSALSEARRNKFVMGETVRSAGVRAMAQLQTREVDQARRWISEHGFSRVVLKPIASSGTFGFHICRGLDEVDRAFADLRGSKDIFGNVVEEVLVQPYIDGTEYCVNAVSRGGRHYVVDIWLTRKKVSGHSKVYDRESLVDPRTPVYQTLTIYTERVLAALGIDFGPSHTEVMIDADGRPVLIETGARFMGSAAQSLVTDALGINALLVTAEAYLAPQQFIARLDRPPPDIDRMPNMVQMVSSTDGVLHRYAIERLTTLATFHGVDLYLQPGDAVKRTVDSYSSPGLIFLSSDDETQLEHDYDLIRAMEARQELYELVAG